MVNLINMEWVFAFTSRYFMMNDKINREITLPRPSEAEIVNSIKSTQFN